MRLVSPSSTSRMSTPASDGSGVLLVPLGAAHALRHRRIEDLDGVQRPGGDGHGKRAALADLAGDVDIAAQGLGDAAADRQSQAGAAELPRDGSVGLHEGIEDGVELLRGDADARVDHLDHQVRIGLVLAPIRPATCTPPVFVNLMALPIRFINSWRNRAGSVEIVSGTPLRQW